METCIHPDSVNWARLNAVSTINTKKSVDLVPLWELFNAWIFVLTRFDVNTSSWTRRRAEETGGTLDITVVVERETVPPTIARRVCPTLIRVLNGDTGTFLELHAEEFERVKPKVFKQFTIGNRETFEDLNYIDLLKE
jgi:hypothetical protein